ncbi:hypothetical protein MLD38_021815 [Melastoma candidum]|uniref:Uncharacterized protein n=1 Tax=Melastoma candidum TaxID=119954 RepID=A0ACB9QL50_9MYRT|nr:hypothetical protein MLD38_021815 [Melastoma candidum]
MREADEEVKHVCKFCDKSFPSGRQLGGHMRSHQNHSNFVDADDVGNKKRRRRRRRRRRRNLDSGENSDGGAGSGPGGSRTAYVLRENPRKSWRIVGESSEDAWLDQDKSCRACGREFGSWKALFGHMKRHALEDRDSRTGNDLGAVAVGGWEDGVGDDDDEEEVAVPSRRRRSERRKKYMVVAASSSSLSLVNNFTNNISNDGNHNAVSSISEIDMELEEVAMCLMMLSKDLSPWKAMDSVVADSSQVNRSSPDAKMGVSMTGNSVSDDLEVKKEVQFQSKVDLPDLGSAKDSNSPQGSQTDHLMEHKITKIVEKKRSLSSDLNDSELGMKTKKVFADDEVSLRVSSGVNSDKRNRFECTTCNKVFHSYQALGGHKASHSKIKDWSDGNITWDTEISRSTNAQKTIEKMANGNSGNKHVCSVCLKGFPSGQALGGHKRSHMQPPSRPAECASTVKRIATGEDSFDLNLPAKFEDEGSSHVTFSSWYNQSQQAANTFPF